MHALDTMRALASTAEVIRLKEGEVLFRTGETGICMYGLLEGSVQLTWIDSAGHEGMKTFLWAMCSVRGPW